MNWLGRIEKAISQFIDGAFTRLTGVQSSHPGLRLRITHGVPLGAEFLVDHTVTVGRDEDNDITLGDPSVSRHHARIEIGRGEAVVKDLGSTNGTFVEGERVTAHSIGPGVRVRFGNTEIGVEAS